MCSRRDRHLSRTLSLTSYRLPPRLPGRWNGGHAPIELKPTDLLGIYSVSLSNSSKSINSTFSYSFPHQGWNFNYRGKNEIPYLQVS